MQLLLEFAGAVQASHLVELRGRLQVVKLDVAEAEVVARELLRRHFLGPALIFKKLRVL